MVVQQSRDHTSRFLQRRNNHLEASKASPACPVGFGTDAVDIAANSFDPSQSLPAFIADSWPKIFLLITSAAPSGRA